MYWYSEPWTWRYWLWLAASFALSAAVAAVARVYARRRDLLDLPGQRRSHTVPTPRGGGIGIVVAALIGIIVLSHGMPSSGSALRLCVALGLVAAIGWIDDHRSLPAVLRLIVHFLAVTIWLWPLIAAIHPPVSAGFRAPSEPLPAILAVCALGLACVWSINLHNFMDGIDGLVSLQAIFVLTVLAVLCMRHGISPHAFQILLWAAAVAGFVLWNFPHARLFMGDVGSGSIGLLIAVAAIWQAFSPASAAASGLVAASALVADASFTLLSRMLCGRRWYRAHREHLYQWMTRTGMTHARVVAWYMGWNVLVVLPVLYYMNLRPSGAPPRAGLVATACVYALALLVWICAKRWCLHQIKTGTGHVAA
jgi:UDP-N-acetylmuramyl pentapeptide phosphotransferase/UDP-N-acetylglucosamine-1-phosphate transferase